MRKSLGRHLALAAPSLLLILMALLVAIGVTARGLYAAIIAAVAVALTYEQRALYEHRRDTRHGRPVH